VLLLLVFQDLLDLFERFLAAAELPDALEARYGRIIKVPEVGTEAPAGLPDETELIVELNRID
jgi:hypothetical protein